MKVSVNRLSLSNIQKEDCNYVYNSMQSSFFSYKDAFSLKLSIVRKNV